VKTFGLAGAFSSGGKVGINGFDLVALVNTLCGRCSIYGCNITGQTRYSRHICLTLTSDIKPKRSQISTPSNN
jgi:hypothetical protein